jgi:hypothetical protein
MESSEDGQSRTEYEYSRVGDGERAASSKCHSILVTGSGLNEAIILIDLEGKV